MNWTQNLHDITRHDDRVERNAPRASLALDTVYMPSELAARLLPINARRAGEPGAFNRSVRDADRGAQAR